MKKDETEFRGKCLPGLYPNNGMPPSSPHSENKVYTALSDALPPNWYAWHSIKIRNKNGILVEGDYIIADPNNGILILEVKGGTIKKQHGKWYQNNKEMKSNPMEQAARFRVSLLAKFREKGTTAPLIGEAVCFPDTTCDEQPTQGDLEGLILGSNELPYLEKCLPILMERALPERYKRKPDPGWIKVLHELWCEHWPCVPNLAVRTRESLEEHLKLDEHQINALMRIRENDLVLVSGGAGTGKTMLTSELAKREAQDGKRVLLLTFTEALGKELGKHLIHDRIRVSPIGKFALEKLRNRGFKDQESYAPEFWNKVTKKAASSRSLWKNEEWDTVIVDEGQDLGKYEWQIVSKCVNKGKRLWVFSDMAQAFWEEKDVAPAFMKKCMRFDLGMPYRCPSSIQALASAYITDDIDQKIVRQGIDQGIIQIVPAHANQVHYEVGRVIADLIEDGFQPNEIAVLSLRGFLFKENIAHQEKLGRHTIVHSTAENAPYNIICDTFLRFKGLERPAIIITDLRHVSDKYKIRMNIAISRAVGVLRIVGSREEILKDEILAPFLPDDTE